MLSSIGTNRNARRTSLVHLSFNVIGTLILLILFCGAQAIFDLSAFVNSTANEFSIAIAHTTFNILCTAMLLPAAGMLEKLSYKLIPEPVSAADEEEEKIELDERLMATPSVALEQCRIVTSTMAALSASALKQALEQLAKYDADSAAAIRRDEDRADRYEDTLGSYLVTLSTRSLGDADSMESAKLLHMIGDLERISDHAVGILESAEELREKGIVFTSQAQKELAVLKEALQETLDLAITAYENNDLRTAMMVEPLKQIIDILKTQLRSHHILRMQKGECTIEAGFVWSDLLTNLGRVADHCSNIAGCVIEMSQSKLALHDYSKLAKEGGYEYADTYDKYSKKYLQHAALSN